MSTRKLRIVSAAEWQAALESLRQQEKAATRARDALAAERRRMPMVQITKAYSFDGEDGKVSLLDLFAGRSQLLLYHFMFAPGVNGWPDAGCPGCSMVADGIAPLGHLHARDTSLVFVSRAPLEKLQAYRRRMGWSVPWYSSEASDFNRDFEITTEKGERAGFSAFLQDEDAIYRTYFASSRGVEALAGVWPLLDITPFGRQETWEDAPEGWPQTAPYQWWRRHDEYDR